MAHNYRVFGDLRVSPDDGVEVEVSGRQAEVLAVLLAAHPEGVSADSLIEQIWGDQLPADPEATLYSAISRLRSVVGDDLSKTTSGYRLRASIVDSAEFERAVAEARATRSLDAFSKADALWQSDPYKGFEDLGNVRIEVERLNRVRRWATRDRLELTIDAGAASEAADELEPMVEADPFDEETLGLLMRALYRAGRKPQALAAFRDYERQLAEETGLEPSAHIRELEVGILTDHLDHQTGESRALVPLHLAVTYVPVGKQHKVAVGRAGTGPPLLVHPGWLSKLDLLDTGVDMRTPMWVELSKRFEVVIFDRAGTGLSREAPLAEDISESVTELIEVTKGCFNSPVAILASSAAGPIVALAANERPDLFSHIVFHGTYASGPETFPAGVADSLVALVRASWGMGSEVLASILFPTGPPEFKEAWSSTQRDFADAETAALLMEQMYSADSTGVLGDLDVPCLVTHYRDDKAIPIRGGQQLALGIPGARFISLEGRTHYPIPGEETDLVQIIWDFFAETNLTED